MKLTVFNGSPRGMQSNTKLLLDHFTSGFEKNGGEVVQVDYLIQENQLKKHVQHFKDADIILLAFPLYVDSLPAMAKAFIEEIGNFDGREKQIFFLVHSGFPEAVHSEGVIRYLEMLTKRWQMQYLGTILKPGSEGIRMRKDKRNQKLYEQFELLGSNLAKSGELDQQILASLKGHYRFPKLILFIIKIIGLTGLMDFYWNKKLKEHKAYEKRFDAPLTQV